MASGEGPLLINSIQSIYIYIFNTIYLRHSVPPVAAGHFYTRVGLGKRQAGSCRRTSARWAGQIDPLWSDITLGRLLQMTSEEDQM